MKKTVVKMKTSKKGYTAADMREVSNNPIWTKEDFAKARPFNEIFPNARKGRGPAKKPVKRPVTIRLDQNVLDFFKKDGAGWQGRINQALVETVEKAFSTKKKRATG